MIVDNLNCHFGSHFYISNLFFTGFVDLDDRLVLADADTAGLGDGHVLQVPFGNLFGKGGQHRPCAGCDSAGSHTHNHTDISFRVITNADFAFHGIAKSLKLC